MRKGGWGIVALAALVVTGGVGASAVALQSSAVDGGVARRVDRQRPSGVTLTKIKRARAAAPAERRIAVLPPAAAAPAALPADQPVAAAVPVAAVREECGCPVVPAALPGAAAGQTEATRQLVARVCAEITRLGPNASPQDLEAAIVFALYQSGASAPVQANALTFFDGYDCGPAGLPQALAAARTGLGGGRPSSAALAGSNFGPLGSGFTIPSLNVGGGSANYTR